MGPTNNTSELELFNFLAAALRVRVEDASTPSTCGGEVEGSLGVKVTLLLMNPLTHQHEVISEDRVSLG